MLGVGCWVLGVGCGMHDARCKMPISWCGFEIFHLILLKILDFKFSDCLRGKRVETYEEVGHFPAEDESFIVGWSMLDVRCWVQGSR